MSDDAAAGEPILIVDDEKNIRRTLRMVLESEGHVVHEAGTIAEAEGVLAGNAVDVILLDVKLGDDNGLELLRALKQRGDDGMTSRTGDIPVVMISGHATIEDAVSATRLGAFDFMEKPLDRNRVMVTVRNALERRRMSTELSTLRHAADARWELLGGTQVMADLRRQIAKVAPTKSRVLITGESGTGKELIARAIHRNSAVAGGSFVKGQLRRDPAGADRERAVRPRARRVHRRGRQEARFVRSGRRRHDLPRRDRRHGPCPRKRRSCACCRPASSRASAARRACAPTAASSPRRTATSSRW